MEYAITFTDVMTGAIGLAVGFMIFMLKRWFEGLNERADRTDEKLTETHRMLSDRMERLEEKTQAQIKDMQDEISDIEKDFPHLYVLREDFFRSMNGVETKMNRMDGKLDRILAQNEKK